VLADRRIAPVKKLPDDKPEGWKLELGELRANEVQRLLDLINLEKNRCIRYWTIVKPPRPMGWAPADKNAWKKGPRADLENGNLLYMTYFTPIWESYRTAKMDI
jgi:hypothetical protein